MQKDLEEGISCFVCEEWYPKSELGSIIQNPEYLYTPYTLCKNCKKAGINDGIAMFLAGFKLKKPEVQQKIIAFLNRKD